ncbi:hypothetical protein BDL97_02G063400 [Sphagnum fallax]|nr:hypothetical protein BDL97_02G063400 [Sphagnum fallax]
MAEKKSAYEMMMERARAGAKGKGGRPPASSSLKAKEAAVTLARKEEEAAAAKDLSTEAGKTAAGIVVLSVADRVALLSKKETEFDPQMAAFWKPGEHVPFIFLASAFDMISDESGRLAMTNILCNVFRTVISTTPQDLLAVVNLSANRIAPAHEGVELGIGDAAIIKVLTEAYGRKDEQIKAQLKTLGDLGSVAKCSRSSQKLMFKPAPLTCMKVLDTFNEIAKEAGNQSQDKKRARMKALLVAATDCEPLYLVRLLQSKLRIGLAEKTVLAALAHAAVLSEVPKVPPAQLAARLEEAEEIMKHTYSVLPIYEQIIDAVLKFGICKLSEVCSFKLGVPVGPMLAKPTTGVSEVLNKFQDMDFTCEYKYDGERAQIHYMEDGTIQIYSRNAEHNTGKFPDIVAAMPRFMKPGVTSFVLDCEVVAYDREKNKILPFQILSTRARKGVSLNTIKVQVCLFAFDLLYLNGHPLLHEQLNIRREHLYASFLEVDGEFRFATAKNSNDLEEIQKFLEDAIDHSCEGLIVKTLTKDATYEPAKRSNNWLKLKKDYMTSTGDSLDLVPIGAFYGRGKRVGVYGAFLLACYDEDREEFQSICKIGTGFSEAVLEERSTTLRSHVIDQPKSYYRYGETIGVDVWFDEVEVWEVKAADLSISPVHRAAIGLVDSSKGISLRFPRLVRLREDKTPVEATSAEQVAELYRAQKINHGTADDNEDDD